jgi:hypothetical protein
MPKSLTTYSKWLSLGLLLAVNTACSSFLNLEDDSQPFFRTVREAMTPNLPVVIDKPLTPQTAAPSQTTPLPPAEPLQNNIPSTVTAKPVTAVAVAPPTVMDETRPSNTKMLFAPYVPNMREGELPRRWQKNPIYDFPWISGAQPVRINEETIVGFGDQMLGRLYARAVFSDMRTDSSRVETAPVSSEPVLPTLDKKSRKNAQNKPVELTPVTNPAQKKKTIIQCDAGAPCLDMARDLLAEDAAAKGWEMLLNRRVSLHNSFQFAKGERVVWIELTSNGGQELELEYTLLPVQTNLQRR